jgi:dTDP-4-dehydrorhamnose reductase
MEPPRRKVLVLGGSGMLGTMLVDYLSRDPDLEITGTLRPGQPQPPGSESLVDVSWRTVDASAPAWPGDVDLGEFEWVVNAVGIIKHLIDEDDADRVEDAIRVNALFPRLLARQALNAGARVLQIATDCVYSGAKGKYEEEDAHDALDVYGKTKSLGEVRQPRFHNLRCSIIGPEAKQRRSLLSWFLDQPRDARLRGFANHLWNGVTTLHFAKLCRGVIRENLDLPRLQHVIPADTVTKHQLLELFAGSYGREDVEIAPTEAATAVDRSLATTRPDLNRALWRSAGYAEPPTVRAMVEELAAFDFRLGEA